MKETLNSVKNIVKERLGSKFYGTFFFAWLTINWKVWYITFFVSGTELLKNKGLLKIDYISNLYKRDNMQSRSIPKTDLIIIWKLFLFPFIMVFIIYYIFNYIEKVIYEKSLKNKHEKEMIKLQKEHEKEQTKGSILDEEIKNQEKEQQQRIRKEKKREEEINEIKDTEGIQNFIEELLYNQSGSTISSNKKRPHLLAIAHSNNLLNVTKNQAELTEKGKFFLRRELNKNR